MRDGLYLITHVIVLILNVYFDRGIGVMTINVVANFKQFRLTCFKRVAIMVADDVL